jgi:hypothetical protein
LPVSAASSCAVMSTVHAYAFGHRGINCRESRQYRLSRRRSCSRSACITLIVAQVRQGSQRDAILFSVGANDQHGLRRTNADKRRGVETLLRDAEWRDNGDNWIAKQCGVAQSFVWKVGKELISEIGSRPERKGQDGKTRRVPKPRAADTDVGHGLDASDPLESDEQRAYRKDKERYYRDQPEPSRAEKLKSAAPDPKQWWVCPKKMISNRSTRLRVRTRKALATRNRTRKVALRVRESQADANQRKQHLHSAFQHGPPSRGKGHAASAGEGLWQEGVGARAGMDRRSVRGAVRQTKAWRAAAQVQLEQGTRGEGEGAETIETESPGAAQTARGVDLDTGVRKVMAIQSRSKRTNKEARRKAPKLGTTPADRRLLARAKRDDAEARPAPSPPNLDFVARELSDLADQLCEAQNDFLSYHEADGQDSRDGLDLLGKLWSASRGAEGRGAAVTRDERDRLIAEGLIRIADRCSEALAAAADPAVDVEGLTENISDINLLVWRLRWDTGPAGGADEPVLDAPRAGSDAALAIVNAVHSATSTEAGGS